MKRNTLALLPALIVTTTTAQAYDITDNFSVGGILSGAGQCQRLSEDAGFDDECKGALLLQPEMSLRPTDNDELFVKFGFATGNGLNTDEE